MRGAQGSTFRGNRVSGSVLNGGLFVDFHESQVTANVISDAPGGGIRVDLACGNDLVANTLTSPSARVALTAATGANRYVGNPSKVVDEGSFDRDGDGTSDPNQILESAP